MPNEQNLIPNSARTPSELRAITSKGGKASGKRRRELKTMADAIRMVLKEQTPEGMTKQEALVAKCLANAFKKGEMKDLKVIAEILGELKQTISAEGLALNISTSEEGKSNIERILKGGAD